MKEEILLTQEGWEKLKNELEDLRKNKRPAVIQRIKNAREFGDLSENAEYEDAKNQQSFVEGRIQELEEMMKRAKVITKTKGTNGGLIYIGNQVTVECEGEKTVYKIVGVTESDPSAGRISSESPIGRALIGKKKGEIIKVPIPDGEMKCKILDIK